MKGLASADVAWCLPRLMFDPRRNQVVGAVGFKDVPRQGRVEIGYNVSPECQRSGYATQALRLLVAEAFASGRVEEVYAEVWVGNAASRRVLQKAGFTPGGAGTCPQGPTEFWSIRTNPQPTRP